MQWPASGSTLISLLNSFALQTSMIYLPIFASEIGASKLGIGIIGGIYGVAYLTSSLFFGRQSDMKGRLIFIRLGLIAAAVGYALQILAGSPLTLTFIRALIGFCLGMSDAALMAYNFEVGGKTGWFASLGALGWLLGAVLAIFVQGYHYLFIISSILSAAAFGVALLLREQPRERRVVKPVMIKMVSRDIGVYLPFFLRNLGGNMVWFIFPLYLQSLGATKMWIAILQCINNGTQVIVMPFVERIKPSRLFVAGLFFSAAVFIAFAFTTHYLQVIPINIVLAISWACLFVGALLLLFKDNEERATSTGILFSSGSFSQATGPFVGGWVAQMWGYQPMMYGAAALCLVGVGVVQTQARRIRKVANPVSRPL
jgi:MFS family permease